MLTKEDILAKVSAKKVETKEIANFGAVGFRVLTGAERVEWEKVAFVDGKVQQGVMMPTLIVRCLCNENGVRLFSNEDADLVNDLPFPTLLALFEEASSVNALGKSDLDEETKN